MHSIHFRQSYFSIVALFFLTYAVQRVSATTTIDVPPDPAPSSISGDTVLNLSNGGTLPDYFDVGSGATINATGGTIGNDFSAGPGTTANISGGNFGDEPYFYGGTISGGTFGQQFSMEFGTLIGSDFEVNGKPIAGLTNIGDTVASPIQKAGTVFSGTFADGSPFAFLFRGATYDNVSFATLQLSAPAAPGPALINSPADTVPNGARSGQTVVVSSGGAIPNNFTAGAGSTVTINDGTVGTNFKAVGNQVNVNGGAIGPNFTTLTGSTANLKGGTIGDNALVGPGSIVNLTGARVGNNLTTYSGSLTISGGVVGTDVTQGGAITLVGTDFRFNGAPVSGLSQVGDKASVNLETGGSVTATLADGTPIVLGRQGDSIGSITVQLSATPIPGPAVVNAPSDPVPLGISNGQTLNVNPTAVIPTSFRAGAATNVNVMGGTIGSDLETVGANVHLSSGSIGTGFLAYAGSNVVVSGGSIGDGMFQSGGTFKITSGSLGNNASIQTSTAQLLGGTTGTNTHISASHATIAGAAIGDNGLFFPGNVPGNSVLDFTSGSLGNGFSLSGGLPSTTVTMNMSGGTTGTGFHVSGTGVTLNLSGGSIGDSFNDSGNVNMTAGSIGNNAIVAGKMTLAGGSIGSNLQVSFSSTLDYSGGTIGAGLQVQGTMDITGTSFLLAGQTIPGLTHAGDSVVFTTAQFSQLFGKQLTGTVVDGTPFSYAWSDFPTPTNGGFSFGSTVRLTLAPEPSSVMLAAVGTLGLALACRGRRKSVRSIE
jgi:hypothetical protein